MPGQVFRPQTAALRLVAVRLGVPDLGAVAAGVNIIEVYRLTVQYADGRHPDQIATLSRARGDLTSTRLSLSYLRPEGKPLTLELRIDADRYQAFSVGLRQLRFDHLDDPPDIPWTGADLWLLERASGAFHHDLIIAPDSASGAYTAVTALLRDKLPEMLRAISP